MANVRTQKEGDARFKPRCVAKSARSPHDPDDPEREPTRSPCDPSHEPHDPCDVRRTLTSIIILNKGRVRSRRRWLSVIKGAIGRSDDATSRRKRTTLKRRAQDSDKMGLAVGRGKRLGGVGGLINQMS